MKPSLSFLRRVPEDRPLPPPTRPRSFAPAGSRHHRDDFTRLQLSPRAPLIVPEGDPCWSFESVELTEFGHARAPPPQRAGPPCPGGQATWALSFCGEPDGSPSRAPRASLPPTVPTCSRDFGLRPNGSLRSPIVALFSSSRFLASRSRPPVAVPSCSPSANRSLRSRIVALGPDLISHLQSAGVLLAPRPILRLARPPMAVSPRGVR